MTRPSQKLREPTDPLMGLASRGRARYWLEVMGRRAQREGWSLAVAMVDLDDFKTVNDRFGHEEGDRVLQVWGRFIRDHLPSGARAFRYGGDEVLLVFPRYTRSDAVSCLRSWIRYVREEGLGGYRIGLSAGVAAYPEDTAHWIELVSLADTALLEAKARGKFAVGTLQWPETRFHWPPPFVPRPLEARSLEQAVHTHPIVIVWGDPGVGKSRLIEEVILRRFPDLARNTFRTGAWGVWISRDHLNAETLKRTVGKALMEGQKVIVEAWPQDDRDLIQVGLHQAWREGWVGEIHVPPMGSGQIQLLVRRALGGWVSRRFLEEVLHYTGGRPAYVGAVLETLVTRGWLAPRGKSYRTLGIPPGLRPEGIRPYWEAQIASLSREARKGLGILGIGEGTVPVHLWESMLDLIGLNGRAIDVMEEIRHLVDEHEAQLRLRDTAFVGFAQMLLNGEERSRVARAFLDAFPQAEDLTRLMWWQWVDEAHAVAMARQWLEEAVASLNVPRVHQILRWVLRDEKRTHLPWVQMVRGWLAFVQGEPREAREILTRFPMEALSPPFRRMRVVAQMDTGNLEDALKDLTWWETHARGGERQNARVYRAMWLVVSRRFAEAETMLKALEGEPDLSPLSRSDVALGIGQIAMFSGKHNRALRYYRKALQILQNFTYPRGEMVSLTALAHLYHHRGHLAQTEALVQRAVERARDAETADVEAFILARMGALYLDQGYLQQGYVHLKEALEICSVSGMVRLLPYVYQDLGRWALYQDDPVRAESHLTRALSLAQTHLKDPHHARLERLWLAGEKGDGPSLTAFIEEEDDILGITLEIVLGLGRPEDWAAVYSLLRERSILDLRARFLRDLMGSVYHAMRGDPDASRDHLRKAYRRLRYLRSPMAYGWYLWGRSLMWAFLGDPRKAREAGTRARKVMDNLGLHYWVRKIHTTAPWYDTSS